MKRVPVEEVVDHINATNPHRGARDAWAGMPANFGDLNWYYGLIPLADLPRVEPISKRDVKRYENFAKKHKRAFPAIVVIGKPPIDAEVADGAHRVAAARALGDNTIHAYVGV